MTATTLHKVPSTASGNPPRWYRSSSPGPARSEDPLWQKSGAGHRAGVRVWAPRMLRDGLPAHDARLARQQVPPSVPLVREALDAGAYVQPATRCRA